jgi:pyridoxal phosphate-dependent aminotransferase EpsN
MYKEMQSRIYLSPPYMCGTEINYIQEAFAANWIAPLGPNVTAFEEEMAAYIGIRHAVATNAGTAAMHLALRYLGAGRGDAVFCSDLTFAGSCNPILYLGAEPVFIDSEPESHGMSPSALEDALQWAKKENRLPKAVIIVDLYGQSADYDSLLPLCARYGVPVIEDAAEAVGATYRGKKCGGFGYINILSFNGNKIINTSGGGMALSDDEAAVKKMLFWATQAREPELHYEHREYGYNYRLSNICAGIGRGQLEGLPHKLRRRREIYEEYSALFEDGGIGMFPIFQKGEPNYWLSLILLPEGIAPDAVCRALAEENIEGRPAWKPMHMQPVFKGCKYFPHEGRDVGGTLFAKGVCLPSGEAIPEAQQAAVAEIVKMLCRRCGRARS